MVVLGALGVVAGEAEHTAAAAKAKRQYMYCNTSKPVSPDGQVGKLADISHSIRPVGAAAAETPTASAPSMSATNSAPSRVAPWSHAIVLLL